MDNATRKVSKVIQGSAASIESEARRFGQRLADEFGATTVDVTYGTFTYIAERVVGQASNRKAEFQFKVTVTFVLGLPESIESGDVVR